MQITLGQILLIVAYGALCSLIYVTANVCIGWLIVIATSVWYAIAAKSAFQNQNRFSFGFSVVGFVCLASFLGFIIQTPTTWNGKNVADLRLSIQRLAWFGKPFPVYEPNQLTAVVGYQHDLTTSGPVVSLGDVEGKPSFHNTMRLAACLSSLCVAFAGGLATWKVVSLGNNGNQPVFRRH